MSRPRSGASDPTTQLGDELDLLAALITVCLLVLTLAGRSGVLRTLLTIGFACYVPGRAIVSNWPLMARWSQAAMPIIYSLVVLGLVATITLWAHYWHPVGVFQAEAVLSLAALCLGTTRRNGGMAWLAVHVGWPASATSKALPAGFFNGSLVKQSPVWVGVLDLDGPCGVTGVNGPLRASHQEVNLLVRMHGAPMGYVRVPVRPQASLTERARAAAEADLAQAVQLHTRCDGGSESETATRCVSLAACPRHFPSDGPGITVVVCTRDRTEKLQDCLSAMGHFSYKSLEILVVDNAPTTDATCDLVASLASADRRIRYTCEPVPGLSRARNHGLAQARYDVVAFTDDDTLADPGWPAALAAGFGSDPETVCVTGLVVASALETSSEQYFAARYARSQALEPQRYDLGCRRSRLYPYAAGIFGSGANFAVRRDAIIRLGGFDPLLGVGSQGRGGEDLDMFLRVILAGGRISYLPSALVWHRHRTSAEDLREQIYSYGHGLGAYLAKHRRNRGLQVALLAHGLGQAGRTARGLFRAALRSRLGMGAMRYAITEIWGFVAGAWSYWKAAS